MVKLAKFHSDNKRYKPYSKICKIEPEIKFNKKFNI